MATTLELVLTSIRASKILWFETTDAQQIIYLFWSSWHGVHFVPWALLTLTYTICSGVSTYNVSPQQAGAYFNKIQCFCFEEQKLRPGEKIDMPVFFYIDPEFATDPKMKGISTLTLSYTFFKVDEEDCALENTAG